MADNKAVAKEIWILLYDDPGCDFDKLCPADRLLFCGLIKKLSRLEFSSCHYPSGEKVKNLRDAEVVVKKFGWRFYQIILLVGEERLFHCRPKDKNRIRSFWIRKPSATSKAIAIAAELKIDWRMES